MNFKNKHCFVRLKSKEKAPLLLPPKDYDTVHRKQGNLIKTGNMKCLNTEIVGKSGVYKILDDDTADVTKQNGEHQPNAGSDATMVLGQSNNPVRRSVNSEYEEARHDEQVVYSSAGTGVRKPFQAAGPNTRELQLSNSYFPEHDLPNYLQTSRSSLNSSTDERDPRNFRGVSVQRSGSGAHSGMRFLRKQQSSPEFSQLPGYKHSRQRSSDIIIPDSFPEQPDTIERGAYVEPPADYSSSRHQRHHHSKLKRVVSGYY